MDYENRFEKILGSVSKDKFRQYANKLLNECFILKECTDTKNCYYFILKEKNLFTSFFSLLGYDIVVNEEYGMIALNNSFGTGRMRAPVKGDVYSRLGSTPHSRAVVNLPNR